MNPINKDWKSNPANTLWENQSWKQVANRQSAQSWWRKNIATSALLSLFLVWWIASQDVHWQKSKSGKPVSGQKKQVKEENDTTGRYIILPSWSYKPSDVKTTKQLQDAIDTTKNPVAHLWYPFTLKIFDDDLNFTQEKLDELENFIKKDLKDKSKWRQIAVNFARGDRGSRKALYRKLIEHVFWYNLLKMENDDTLYLKNKWYELYNTYYAPLMGDNQIWGKNTVLTPDQLISSLETSFNAAVVSPAIDYINTPTHSLQSRFAKVDEFFEVLGKLYNRRKYISEAADPQAPIKLQDDRDAIEFANSLIKKKTASTKIEETRAQWFNLDDKTIDENIHILEKVIAQQDIEWVSLILDKILASNKSQVFTIKYRLYKLVKALPQDLKTAKTKEDKMKVIYAFSKRLEVALDIADITMNDKSLKDILKGILNEEYANEIYGDLDSQEMTEIANLIDDIDKTDVPFDLEWNPLDGMNQAEIDDLIRDAIDKDNTLYQMYRYMEHITKVKVINEKNKSIVDHFSRVDKKWRYIYTNEKAHFNSLTYVEPDVFFKLVDNVNRNPNIKEVRFNLNLMKKSYSPENFIRVVKAMGNLKKHVILDTENEFTTMASYADSLKQNYSMDALGEFIKVHNTSARWYSVTYNASMLSEIEADLLFTLSGSVHIPRCESFPWNTNEAFEKAISSWQKNNPWGTLDMWFLAMGKNAYRSLANVFNSNQFYVIHLDGIQTLQKEELEWLNRINCTLTTNALSYQKMWPTAQYVLNFWLPPQTDGFFTEEQVIGKKQKSGWPKVVNNRGIAWFHSISEEDIKYAEKYFKWARLELWEWNIQSHHMSAYRNMENLVDLRLHTSERGQDKSDSLKWTKINTLMLYKYNSGDEAVLKWLVETVKTLVLPDFDAINKSTYDKESNKRENAQLAALFSTENNIYMPSIKQIDMGWAILLSQKKGGSVSLAGDMEWHEWVQSILLKDQKWNDIEVTSDNCHEHRELLVPFFKNVYKSWAKVEFGSRIQRIYNDYISLKSKR